MVLVSQHKQRQLKLFVLIAYVMAALLMPLMAFAADDGGGSPGSGAPTSGQPTGDGGNDPGDGDQSWWDPIKNYNFPDISQTLTNIQQTLPHINALVSALAYTIGFYMFFKAFYELKKYGEARTMMSANTDLRGPMMMMIVGTAALFFPTILNMSLITVFGNDNILMYGPTDNATFDLARTTIILVVQTIGAIAFLRGLLFFYKSGTGQSQPGTLTKGFTHTLGGILCLNIVAAKNVLYTTLGIVGS